MLFNSFEFLTLTIASFAIYYLSIFRRYQVQILIVASLIFYGYANPKLLLLFLFSVLINVISSYSVVYGKRSTQKTVLTIGVIFNLSILAFFKYSPLIGSTFFNTGNGIGAFLIQIPLPVGISFFTFEGITLLVDAYRGRDEAKSENLVIPSLGTHAMHTTFFVAFFPHLIAGPILKAHHFLPQIKEKFFKDIPWEFCYRNLVTGYFLKMVIADQLSQHTFWIQYPYFEVKSSIELIVLLFGYSIQIFADFAGYSLIALGIAGLFGYKLEKNFDFPYISTSFSEFWRRWHISLSTFLKEYLYIPLGGNRRGPFRTYLNLFVTMLLGGLWHGAAWSYAIWGAFHGCALAIERFVKDHGKQKDKAMPVFMNILSGLLVFMFVTFAWLFFKLTNISDVVKYVAAIFNNTHVAPSMSSMAYVLMYSLPVIAYHLLYLSKNLMPDVLRWSNFEAYAHGLMLFMIVTNSGISGDFIYFQF
ncbi:MBOAT family O-acyltransferase [Dyadobacter endophyticus]|uniref:MBOAT family O-acyltransferase n=1 Tax=Dyadobacter endophyticus TaxID=1749036 RepID=UPI003CF4001A